MNTDNHQITLPYKDYQKLVSNQKTDSEAEKAIQYDKLMEIIEYSIEGKPLELFLKGNRFKIVKIDI